MLVFRRFSALRDPEPESDSLAPRPGQDERHRQTLDDELRDLD